MSATHEGAAALIESEIGQPIDDPDMLRRTAVTALRECDELKMVIAALVFFAPSYDVTVRPFATAHQWACALLAEHELKLTPNEIGEAVDSWKREATAQVARETLEQLTGEPDS